jgi:hypothetical protein
MINVLNILGKINKNKLANAIVAVSLLVMPHIVRTKGEVLNMSPPILRSDSKDPTQTPNFYLNMWLAVFVVVSPWIIANYPSLITDNSQMMVAIVVLLLDWGSFIQDKTRFGETVGTNEKGEVVSDKTAKGVTGSCAVNTLGDTWDAYMPSMFKGMVTNMSCRDNAFWTGNLAHLSDIFGIYLIMRSTMSASGLASLNMVTGLYVIVGVLLISAYTANGGLGDLRNLTEEQKCKKTCQDGDSSWDCLWRDDARGFFNIIITFLGVFAGWQGLMNVAWGSDLGGLKTALGSMKFNNVLSGWVLHFAEFLKKSGNMSLKTIGSIILAVAMGIVPTYLNKINTSYQYSAHHDDMGLPACFK